MACDDAKLLLEAVSDAASAGGLAEALSNLAAAIEVSSVTVTVSCVSECAIERIEYEIGKQRHDALGDKEYEVVVHVEPWRAESLVKLVYHQQDLGLVVQSQAHCSRFGPGSGQEPAMVQCTWLRWHLRARTARAGRREERRQG